MPPQLDPSGGDEQIAAHGSLEHPAPRQQRRIATHARGACQGEVLADGVEVVLHLAGDIRADTAGLDGAVHGARQLDVPGHGDHVSPHLAGHRETLCEGEEISGQDSVDIDDAAGCDERAVVVFPRWQRVVGALVQPKWAWFGAAGAPRASRGANISRRVSDERAGRR